MSSSIPAELETPLALIFGTIRSLQNQINQLPDQHPFKRAVVRKDLVTGLDHARFLLSHWPAPDSFPSSAGPHGNANENRPFYPGPDLSLILMDDTDSYDSERSDNDHRRHDDIDEDTEDDEEPQPVRPAKRPRKENCPEKKAQREKAIRDRQVDILSTLQTCDPISPQQLASIIAQASETNTLKHADAEDRALKVLCLGYERADNSVWTACLRDVSSSRQRVQQSSIGSSRIDEIKNLDARIISRHNHISTITNAQHITAFVDVLLIQIEALKFAQDWSLLSKLKKSSWYLDAFSKTDNIRGTAQGLPPKELKLFITSHHRQEYEGWKKLQQIRVTARHRLLLLYNVFGESVLLDPFWSVTQLGRTTSRDFPAVLDKVTSTALSVNQRPNLISLRLSGRLAFRATLSNIAPQRTVDFVSQFLDRHPPTALAS